MKLVKILTLIALPFLYLLFSYVRFYHYIGYINLRSPYVNNPLTFENALGDGAVSYVALGDSLTAGVGSSDFAETFTYIYAKGLSDLHRQVILTNLGQAGGTSEDVINNQLTEAIKIDPDYITLLIGTNDMHNRKSLKAFYDNYSYILSELQAETHAHITVLNIPYLGSNKLVYPPFNVLLNYRTNQFNEAIEEAVNNVSDKERVTLIDLYRNTYLISKLDPNYYSSDEFHPSGKGYIIWGELINDH